MEQSPAVYVDESGNSGQNLFDAQQPAFVLAAIHMAEPESQRIAGILAGDSDEGHYTRLRRSRPGRQRIVQALGDEALRDGAVRVSALHKGFMAVAKLVDLLFEPVIAAAGEDLYKSGWHMKLSHMLHDLGPTACGDAWQPLATSFVEFVWRGTEAGARDLAKALARAVRRAGDHPVGEFLDMVPRDPAILVDWHGREPREQSADALDAALTATVEQAVWWGQRLGPFLLVYDESKLIGRWTERLLALSDPAVAAEHNITESNPMPVLPLAGLQSATSHDVPAVQVADTVAGACAEVLRGRVLGGDPSEWEVELRDARVLRFVDHLVWPHDSAVAEEFRLQGCFDEEA